MFNSSIPAPVAPVIDDPSLDEEDLTDEDPQDEEEEEDDDDEQCFYDDDDDDDDEYGYGRKSRSRYLRWLNDDGSMSAYERNL